MPLALYTLNLNGVARRLLPPPGLSENAFTKSPKEVLESYFATGSDYYRDPNGCVPAIAIQKPIDAMVEEKLIPQPVDASKYLALSYLPRPCST